MALLAQQGVAAIAGAEALDGERFREVHDEAAVRVEFAGGMQALHVRAVGGNALQCCLAHARHEAHVDDHIGGVGNLDAATRIRGANRAHAIGHYIKRASAHATGEQGIHGGVCLHGIHPRVVGASVFLLFGADEGEVFYARDVGRMRAVEMATREGVAIQRQEVTGLLKARDQRSVFFGGAVAPVNLVRLRVPGGFFHPLHQRCRGAIRDHRHELRRPSRNQRDLQYNAVQHPESSQSAMAAITGAAVYKCARKVTETGELGRPMG